jgi:hypothetical protein
MMLGFQLRSWLDIMMVVAFDCMYWPRTQLQLFGQRSRRFQRFLARNKRVTSQYLPAACWQRKKRCKYL